MPAPGGPTNQSGIGYQNAVAALYLGRLCDGTARPSTEIVCEVRVETYGSVDDIEVMAGDDSRKWMQAKERVSGSSEEWRALWRAFLDRRHQLNLARGDRLTLWLGHASKQQYDLAEATKRARYAPGFAEWWADLSKEQQAAAHSINDLLELQCDHDASFELMRFVDIEVVSRERLVDRVPYWIPAARNTTQHAVYEVLQSKALDGARYRRLFTKADLLRDLHAVGIEIIRPQPGVDAYRAAIQRETASMTVPGTALRGQTRDVFHPPRMRIWHSSLAPSTAAAQFSSRDVDDVVVDEGGEPVRVEDLPSGPADRVVLIGGAGSGKSGLVAALAHRLSASAWVPAIIRLVELANSNTEVLTFLDERVAARYAARLDWLSLCEAGLALIFFDGLDELPLHLRSKVLDDIHAFSARFPRTPWLMTVRDMAGTAAPIDARVVKLQPLTTNDIERFCRGWLPAGRASLAATIAQKISISRELQRMARIPFLLALMIEHAITSDAPVPTRRIELLEKYVGMLLRPEKHKPAINGIDSSILRNAAENLAFAALDAGEVDISVRRAATIIGGASSQGVLDALVARGVLRESRDRYEFVFPILQEYLAGYHLASHRHDEITGRFETEVSRPWTQALQFAIEISDQSDSIVVALLATPDDAFRTKLKILGRCVANGARISITTRARIGDELAARWISEDRQGRWTGELLADGYAKALPDAANRRVRGGEQLEFGGAAIVVTTDDPRLTEAVLKEQLAAGFAGHVRDWQSAIDKIAPAAARLYLERATATQTKYPERERHWLAYLLGRVADVTTQDDPRVVFARDPAGDPFLRLACLLRLGTPLAGDSEELVLTCFRQYVATESAHSSPAFDLVLDAIFRLPRAIDVWHACLALLETTPLGTERGSWWLRGMTPEEAYWRIVVFAIVPRTNQDEAAKRISDLAALNALSQTRKDYIDLVLAFLQDDDAFARLANRIETTRVRDAHIWIFLASSRPAALVAPALQRLRDAPAGDRVELAFALGFALFYEIELHGLEGGASGKARRLHGAAAEATKLLLSWAREAKPGSKEWFACTAQAVNLGATSSAAPLLDEIITCIRHPVDADKDHRLADALTAVAQAGIAVPTDVLLRAARVSNSNLALRAYDQLERHRTSAALDHLLLLHATAPKHNQLVIAQHVERLARSLAVRITMDPSGRLRRVS